jgi:hypothetical protein
MAHAVTPNERAHVSHGIHTLGAVGSTLKSNWSEAIGGLPPVESWSDHELRGEASRGVYFAMRLLEVQGGISGICVLVRSGPTATSDAWQVARWHHRSVRVRPLRSRGLCERARS